MRVPTIITQQFTLRAHRMSDVASIVRNVNDRTIARNTAAIPYPYRPSDARTWILRCQRKNRQAVPTDIVWVIDVGGGAVGAIGLHHIKPRHKAELGYWLGKSYREQGIMSAAVALVTRWGFQHLSLARIYAFTYVYNPISSQVLLKNGFRYEGRLRKNTRKSGKLVDVNVYAKVK
ncbi:MAG: GNAT family N-acetyltransferase [Candidatus Kerfeldbacteria bacterium]|nr:GNAT family N-acetyltransferase [Candidatus Kerfeldbacteria bacterium]